MPATAAATAPHDTLESLRHEIDQIDEGICALIARRLALAPRIAAAKSAAGPLDDPAREDAVFARVAAAGVPRALGEAMWRPLMTEMRRRQQAVREGWRA